MEQNAKTPLNIKTAFINNRIKALPTMRPKYLLKIPQFALSKRLVQFWLNVQLKWLQLFHGELKQLAQALLSRSVAFAQCFQFP